MKKTPNGENSYIKRTKKKSYFYKIIWQKKKKKGKNMTINLYDFDGLTLWATHAHKTSNKSHICKQQQPKKQEIKKNK